MNRRTTLVATGLALSVPFGGCLASDDENDTGEDGDTDDSLDESQYPCYTVLEIRAIDVEDHVDWDAETPTVTPSDDDRIADVSELQTLLDEAVASTETYVHEHGETELEAVETAVYDEYRQNPIDELPTESVSSVPSGPFVRHEHRRFVLESRLFNQCDE